MQIDHLDAIAPRIAKIASKWWFQFQSILLRHLLTDLGNLLLVADHQPEMPGSIRLELRYLEDGEELMLAQLKEGVAFTTVELLQIKDVFIKLHRCLDVVDFDCQMIAAVDLHAHARIINQFTGSGEPTNSERRTRAMVRWVASIFSGATLRRREVRCNLESAQISHLVGSYCHGFTPLR